MYSRKYVIDSSGLLICIVLIIQPIWVIDEYARSVRIWDWFIPMIPPNKAFKMALIVIRVLEKGFRVRHEKHSRLKGANFCQVVRSRA